MVGILRKFSTAVLSGVIISSTILEISTVEAQAQDWTTEPRTIWETQWTIFASRVVAAFSPDETCEHVAATHNGFWVNDQVTYRGLQRDEETGSLKCYITRDFFNDETSISLAYRVGPVCKTPQYDPSTFPRLYYTNGRGDGFYGVCPGDVDWDENGPIDPNGGTATKEELFASCSRVIEGNPTSLPDRVKVEQVVDWVSPKDSRFNLSRFYRSDRLLESRGGSQDNLFKFGPGWRSSLNEFIEFDIDSEDARIVYRAGSGQTIAFKSDVADGYFTPKSTNHNFQLYIASDDILILTDGTGIERHFRSSTNDLWTLEDILWPDGYQLHLNRNHSNRYLLSVFDNRNQRAEMMWANDPSSAGGSNRLEAVRIDTSYAGTGFFVDDTFDPNVELQYVYNANDELERILLVDPVDQSEKLVAAYGYTNIGEDGYPLLSQIYYRTDGDVDRVWGEYSYEYDEASEEYLVTRSQHPGNYDSFDFATVSSEEGIDSVTSTNALGKTLSYLFEGEEGTTRRITSMVQQSTANTAETTLSMAYNEDGYLTQRRERNGAVTRFERNSRGYPTRITENAEGASPRVTTTTWHPELRLPLTIETSHLRTAFTYDEDGVLLSTTMTDILAGSPSNGSTRTVTLIYDTLENGLKVVASIDGPGSASEGVNDVVSYTYNADGTVATMVDANGHTTHYGAYSRLGQPTRVFTADGILYGYEYDIEGRVLSVTRNPNGASPETTTFDYDQAGLLTSTTDTRGHTWLYSYDDAKRLVATTNPLGEVMELTYNALGNVTATTYLDSTGVQHYYSQASFDELGRALQLIDHEGQITSTMGYDLEDNLVSVTDSDGFEVSHVMDTLNRVSSTTDQAGYTVSTEHNDLNALTSFEDPRNIETRFEYNGFGDVVREISADRGTMTYAYDRRGLVTSMVDGRGVERRYTYDNGGRIISIDYPSAPEETVTFTYGVPSQVVPDFQENVTGTLTTHSMLASIEDEAGTVEMTYGANGTLSNETFSYASPGGGTDLYTQSYAYDDEGNLLEMTYPSGMALSYTYDAQGQITEVARATDAGPESIASDLAYLPMGPLASLTFGNGQIHTSTFDQSYRLTGQQDTATTAGGGNPDAPVGQAGTVTINQSGPDQWHSITFDASIPNPVVVVGPLTRNSKAPATTRVRNVTSAGFELQIDEWDYLDGKHKSEIIGWMAVSEGTHTLENGLTIVAGTATASSTQSTITLPTSVSNPIVLADVTSANEPQAVVPRISGVKTNRFNVRLQREEAGGAHGTETLSWIALSTGEYADVEVDRSKKNMSTRARKFTFAGDYGDTPVVLADIQTRNSADPAAVRIKLLSPTQFRAYVEEEKSNDNEVRVRGKERIGWVALAPGLLQPMGGETTTTDAVAAMDISYAYTPRHELASITDNTGQRATETYSYTPSGALAEASGDWGSFVWDYDGVRNRVSQVYDALGVPTVTESYNYNADRNHLISVAANDVATRGFTYDGAGNTINDNRSGTDYAYSYNAAGRLSALSVNGVAMAEYVYNARGQQVVRRLLQEQVEIRSFFGPDGNRIAEYGVNTLTGDAELLREYVWANGQVIAVIERGDLFYMRTDHIGRPAFATDADGAVVWEARYEPFGAVEITDRRPVSLLAQEDISLRFPGQWFQLEHGLHHNWMRDYDPTTGRYIQADPLGLVDGASVYGYALQNPMMYTDPRGLHSETWSDWFSRKLRSNTSHECPGVNDGVEGFDIIDPNTLLPPTLPKARIPGADWLLPETAHEYTIENAPNIVWHRREAPGGLAWRMIVYERTGMLTGGRNRLQAGGTKTINAFAGPLPDGMRGFEFTTPIPPSSMRNHGGFVFQPGPVWNEESPGVVDLSEGYIGIPIVIGRVNE